MTETATLPLEHMVEDLDEQEKLRKVKNDQAREVLIEQRVMLARIRIGDLFKRRAEVRRTLRLPEAPPNG